MSVDVEKYSSYVSCHIGMVRRVWEKFRDENIDGLSMYLRDALNSRCRFHDESKWSDSEFFQYAAYFDSTPKDTSKETEAAFNRAWQHHYSVNDHHPEFWDGANMFEEAILEMLCDWTAMSLTVGKGSPSEFYSNSAKNDKKKNLSSKTKEEIEKYLPAFDKVYKEIKGEIGNAS